MTWRGPQAAEGNETVCQCAPPSLVVSSVVCLANVPGALGTTVTASPVEAAIHDLELFLKRWPVAVRSLITGRYKIDA